MEMESFISLGGTIILLTLFAQGCIFWHLVCEKCHFLKRQIKEAKMG